MPRILLVGVDSPLVRWLSGRLDASQDVEACRIYLPEEGDDPESAVGDHNFDTVIVRPSLDRQLRERPRFAVLERTLQACAAAPLSRAILVSSTTAYAPSHHHPGLIREEHRLRRARNEAASRWRRFERLFFSHFRKKSPGRSIVLRAAPIVEPGEEDPLADFLGRKKRTASAGFNPPLQLLRKEDLLQALLAALSGTAGGTFNVVPRSVIPLREAIRRTSGFCLPVPHSLRKGFQKMVSTLSTSPHPALLEYTRYSFTASGEKIRSELGFEPRYGSAAALESTPSTDEDFDPFGQDREFIRSCGRTLFRFLHDYYWRVEEEGLENVPAQGRGVLVGVHRGFIPWDAVMILHAIVQRRGRYPRFLIHPSLLKFPGLSDSMTKLGGVLATRRNASYMLQRDRLIGIYPEGIRGAFTMYRDAYKLDRFKRTNFIRIALENRAPLIPVATVGSAEIYPIFGKIDWRRLNRLTEWPFLPITPTFPFLPFPLPSKWHTRFLPPIHIEKEFPPEAARDSDVVQRINERVRGRIAAALKELLKRRRSIFYGSLRDLD